MPIARVRKLATSSQTFRASRSLSIPLVTTRKLYKNKTYISLVGSRPVIVLLEECLCRLEYLRPVGSLPQQSMKAQHGSKCSQREWVSSRVLRQTSVIRDKVLGASSVGMTVETPVRRVTSIHAT